MALKGKCFEARGSREVDAGVCALTRASREITKRECKDMLLKETTMEGQ